MAHATHTPHTYRPWLLAAALLAAPLAAMAVDSSVATLSVIQDQDAQPLQEHLHGGRTYVAGERGRAYTVAVHNPTSAPVLAVVSVDGVNVLDGKTASYSGQGYVIAPYANVRITGWRKSMDEVARFNFSSAGGAYASRTGRNQDVGVIGAAIFRMKPHRFMTPQLANTLGPANDTGQPTARSSAEMLSKQSLGTGHGSREASPVTTVDFERASSRPASVLALYYDDFDTLVAKGIIAQSTEPSPFPAEPKVRRQFVPDPQ